MGVLEEELLDAIPYPAWLMNRERQVISVNGHGRGLGLKRGEACCRQVRRLHAPEAAGGDDAVRVRCAFCRADDAVRDNRTVTLRTELAGRPARVVWSPVQGRDGLLLHCIVDLTGDDNALVEEYLRQQDELRQELAVSRALAEVAGIMARVGSTLPQVAAAVLEWGLRLTGSLSGFVLLAADAPDGVAVATPPLVGSALDEELELATAALDAGTPLLVPCYDPRLPLRRGEDALLVYPILHGSRRLGAIVLIRPGKDHPPTHLRLVDSLADLLCTAICRAEDDEGRRADAARYRSFFHNNHAVMLLVNPRSGTIVDANPAACVFYGWTRNELVGMSVARINCLPPEEVERAMSGAAVDGGRRFAFRHRLANGRVRDVDVCSGPLEFGGETMLYSIVYDVTDRLRLEEELIEAIAGAQRANRAKSTFLANMSHEIRTPLNGMLGMLQILADLDPTREQKECIDTAISCSASLLKLLNEILDISRVEAERIVLQREAIDTAALLRDLQLILAPKYDRSEVVFGVRCDPAVPQRFWGDEIRLRQILLNLVGNALKFTERGSVTLAVALAGWCDDGRARLAFRVEDSGIGIPDEMLAQIFEPFTQVDSSYRKRFQGAGLGLAIVKGLVDLMGGEIGIDSRTGVGTTVEVVLGVELCADAPPPAAVAPAVPRSGDSRGLKILVVEDNAVNRAAVTMMLTRRGHAAEAANDGREALALLAATQFDLVLMDIQMPVMDGVEAFRRLRSGEAGELNRFTPVIALTAYAMDGDEASFLNAGMEGYLAKPVDWRELDRRLRVLSG